MYSNIKTFEDACVKLSISSALPDVSMLKEKNQKSVIANYKLDIIQEAVNDNWIADWDNYSQYKYYPWFKRFSSGSGFSFVAYDCVYSYSDVGSRRVFSSSEIAIYMAKQFIDLYNDSMWID